MFDRRLLEDFDWVLLLTVITICIIGLVSIYSASYSYGTETPYFQKQVIWFLIGLVVMAIVTMIDYRFLERVSPLLYIFLILLLVYVLVYGTGGPGTRGSNWGRFLYNLLSSSNMYLCSILRITLTNRDASESWELKRLPGRLQRRSYRSP